MRRGAALFAAAALMLALTGCGAGTSGGRSGSTSGEVSGTVTVFAAASLTEAFTTIGQQFEHAHPGTVVRFSFGPSSGLAQQVGQGAPVDVFASADEVTMERVRAAGHVSRVDGLAQNRLEIAVPPGNPAHVSSLADLAAPQVKVALCQPEVPCGTLTARVLKSAGQVVRPVTLETDVKAVLAKVSLGEVDAGLVYVTDVRAARGAVLGVPIPAGVNSSTQYPIATLTDAPNAAGAAAFVRFVLSDVGRSALAADGFEAP